MPQGQMEQVGIDLAARPTNGMNDLALGLVPSNRASRRSGGDLRLGTGERPDVSQHATDIRVLVDMRPYGSGYCQEDQAWRVALFVGEDTHLRADSIGDGVELSSCSVASVEVSDLPKARLRWSAP